MIAAVNGAAIAGGCGIATLADFTLAVPEAKFGYTEVKIGFIPALVSVFLRRQIGEKQARDLLLSGRIIDAAEAFRLGLVTEIVPSEKLMARAREIAASAACGKPHQHRAHEESAAELRSRGIRAELEMAIASQCGHSLDSRFREGITSFLEKRARNGRAVERRGQPYRAQSDTLSCR